MTGISFEKSILFLFCLTVFYLNKLSLNKIIQGRFFKNPPIMTYRFIRVFLKKIAYNDIPNFAFSYLKENIFLYSYLKTFILCRSNIFSYLTSIIMNLKHRIIKKNDQMFKYNKNKHFNRVENNIIFH